MQFGKNNSGRNSNGGSTLNLEMEKIQIYAFFLDTGDTEHAGDYCRELGI